MTQDFVCLPRCRGKTALRIPFGSQSINGSTSYTSPYLFYNTPNIGPRSLGTNELLLLLVKYSVCSGCSTLVATGKVHWLLHVYDSVAFTELSSKNKTSCDVL